MGKTSAARIYAKALECTSGTGAEPCNQCERCRAISSGQDIDVVEIDAASNRGIDEIRQLRQNVAVRPARGMEIRERLLLKARLRAHSQAPLRNK